MPKSKLPQLKKDDPFVDLYSARLLIKTIVWATTEIIELVRVDTSNRCDLRYQRRFIKRPSIYDIEGIKDRTEREGMYILLLEPEDERVINPSEPYIVDHPTAISPYALYLSNDGKIDQ